MRFIPGSSALFLCIVYLLAARVSADLPVSPQVLDPKTPAEAWNVIRLSTANVARLLREQRLQEVAQQISLCSPSLRLLAGAAAPEHRVLVDEKTALAFRNVNELAQAAMSRGQQEAEASFARLEAVIAAMRPAFSNEAVHAEIYVCPEHPEMLATSPDARCTTCNRALRIRRIPYTDLYVAQTPSAVRLSVAVDAPLVAGAPAKFIARLHDAKGAALPSADLLPLHGAPLHLLLLDPRGEDYHLVTPAPAEKPGEWNATFTPASGGSYRVWAEILPVETALPEYPATDLGGEFRAVPLSDATERFNATVDGFKFKLSFSGGTAGAPPARQISMMFIKVADAADQPVARLEPFKQAFAHVTGFYDDGKTLLRLHPAMGNVLRDDLRGGPSLAFKIYPPQNGFIRFFCQVRIDGRMLTVPFGVNVTK